MISQDAGFERECWIARLSEDTEPPEEKSFETVCQECSTYSRATYVQNEDKGRLPAVELPLRSIVVLSPAAGKC